MTKALVIGGGIAGPVAAMALAQAGIECVVHEASAADAGDLGGWLGLQANGLDALQAIGADQPLLEFGFATPAVRFVSGTGKVLGVVPVNSPRPGARDGRTMRRADLFGALRQEAERRGVETRYESRLVDVHQSPTGVQAGFADGTTDHADLLIGADGVRSRVRALLNPAAGPARYVPVLSIGGYSETTPADAQVGELTMCFGHRAFFGYVAAPSGQTWWFAHLPVPQQPTKQELATTTDAEWRTRLRESYRADRFPALELLDGTVSELQAWRAYDLASVPVWHDDQIVLIGDAVHAVSPSTGQGASLAVEDAVELGRCLRDLPVPEAFAQFERVRRPRVERIVAVGQRSSRPKPAGALTRRGRDLMMPVALRVAARRGAPPAAWIHQHHIDWQTPARIETPGGPSAARGHAVAGKRRVRAWLS